MTLSSSWHFMRILRLVVALWAAFQFYHTHDWIFALFGGLFALQAIFNVGCCGATGCAPTTNQRPYDEARVVEYEEVK